MKSFLLPVFFLFGGVTIMKAQESPADFMTRWVEAYNGNQADVMASFYENSPEVDCLISAGIGRRGFKEVHQMYLDDMEAVRFYDSKAEKMHHRMIADGVAVVSFIHQFKYQLRGDDRHFQSKVRTTVTLRRVGELWKIAQEHSSAIQGIERVQPTEAPPAAAGQKLDEDILEAFPIVPADGEE